MLELASLGAQVLMNRSVELAKRYGVELEVLSSYVRAPGTKVKEVAKRMEEMKITGIAKDEKVARVTVVRIADQPGSAFRVLNTVAKAGVNVDMIIQANGEGGANDMSFVVPEGEADVAYAALEARRDAIGFRDMTIDKNIAKVSVVGAGIMSSVGVASLMFEALNDAHINIQMISTSEIKISCVIRREEADRAVACYRRHYAREGIFLTPLYDGIEKMLEDLAAMGKELFVVTSKPKESAEVLLEHTGILHRFQEVIGPDGTNRHPDKAVLIRKALDGIAEKETEAAACHALMVGDRFYDIKGAVAAGVDSVGVLYGYGSRRELQEAGATYLAGTPAEITDFVRRACSGDGAS